MAEIVGSLFGVTPELYQEQRDQMARQRAMQLARMAPLEQASYGAARAGQQLGGAFASAMGVEDPQMRLISLRNSLAKQIDVRTPEGLTQYANALQQAGDTAGALEAIGMSRKMTQEMALTGQRQAAERSSLATAAKTELSIEQENKLRNELSQLPPDATQEQVLGVITKYGSPDKILAVLQGTADKAAANQARIDAANAANQARLDAAKVAADARIEAAKLAGATALQIAQLRADSAREMRQLATSLKGPKVLAPSLQKEEDKELELVDSLAARETSLAPAIASLTIDPKTNKAPLELGPLNNAKYLAQNAAGRSTDESRAYASLQRAVQEATNLKTDAAKGVQTDKDVLRFANELIAAFGGNDTKTSLEALSNFVKATGKAKENAQKRIDSRRRSQGVEPYYGPAAGTAQNPIKLD
jgi:colicin import membrane protein